MYGLLPDRSNSAVAAARDSWTTTDPRAADRLDRRLAEHQSGRRKVVIANARPWPAIKPAIGPVIGGLFSRENR
jgi:hypothetical protein